MIVGKKRCQSSTQRTKKKRSEENELTTRHEVNKKPTVGKFAALRLKKYDDEVPQIAKVKTITNLEVTVEWWIGRWGDTWTEWKQQGKAVEETVHQNAIIMAPIELSRSNRLTKNTIIEL